MLGSTNMHTSYSHNSADDLDAQTDKTATSNKITVFQVNSTIVSLSYLI